MHNKCHCYPPNSTTIMLHKTVLFSWFSSIDYWDDLSEEAADNVVEFELELLEAMFLLI